jgi:hypothetical protein
MTSINTSTNAQFLAALTDEELARDLGMAHTWLAMDSSSIELVGLLVQERIRRHALACQDFDCGFNPMG